VNFKEMGRILDHEATKLAEYLDREVKPKTRQDLADLLRRASRRLEDFAADIEKEQRSRNDAG
jgi:hypothetical protein